MLKIRDLLLVLLLAYFIPKAAYILASNWSVHFNGIDPENVFAWSFIHHIVQMVLALIVILLLIWKKPFADWGFNLNDKTWSLKTAGKFCIGWIIIIPVGTLIFQILSGWPGIVDYPLNT